MAYAISDDGKVKVEWENIGEGLCGDYDSDDPEDRELLRFYSYGNIADPRATDRMDEFSADDDGWADLEDGSYCTYIEEGTDEEILVRLAKHIANELSDALGAGSFKRTAEAMSWVQP